MPTYPNSLSEPVAKGFSFKKKDLYLSNVMDSGKNRRRRSSLGSVYNFTATFSLKSDADVAEFKRFLIYDINYGDFWFGANWFTGAGFYEGTMIFKFLNVNVDLFSYKGVFNITLQAGLISEITTDENFWLDNGLWPTSTADGFHLPTISGGNVVNDDVPVVNDGEQVGDGDATLGGPVSDVVYATQYVRFFGYISGSQGYLTDKYTNWSGVRESAYVLDNPAVDFYYTLAPIPMGLPPYTNNPFWPYPSTNDYPVGFARKNGPISGRGNFSNQATKVWSAGYIYSFAIWDTQGLIDRFRSYVSAGRGSYFVSFAYYLRDQGLLVNPTATVLIEFIGVTGSVLKSIGIKNVSATDEWFLFEEEGIIPIGSQYVRTRIEGSPGSSAADVWLFVDNQDIHFATDNWNETLDP